MKKISIFNNIIYLILIIEIIAITILHTNKIIELKNRVVKLESQVIELQEGK